MKDYLRLLPKSLFEKKSNVASVDSFATLETLRQEFLVIAEQLSTPRKLVKLHTLRQDDGSPHMEMAGDKFQYIVTERGETLQIRSSTDRNEALFWLVKDLTRSVATDFELNHRVEGQDSRRLWMAKHVEFMQSINPAWAERVAGEYESILVDHPFDDRPWYEVYPECFVDEGTENHEDSVQG